LALIHVWLISLYIIALATDKYHHCCLLTICCPKQPQNYRSLFFLLSSLFHAFTIIYRVIMAVVALTGKGGRTMVSLVDFFNCLALAAVLASFLVLTRMWLGAAATLGR